MQNSFEVAKIFAMASARAIFDGEHPPVKDQWRCHDKLIGRVRSQEDERRSTRPKFISFPKTKNKFDHFDSSVFIGAFNVCHCPFSDSPDKTADQ